MANTPKQLAQQAIGTTVTTAYTAPNVANAYAFIESIVLCNTTTSRKLVRIYLVPNGGSAATGNAIAYDFVLDIPGMPYVINPKAIIGQNATIQTSADATGVTMTVSGIEVQ